jgi:hypothetical protein
MTSWKALAFSFVTAAALLITPAAVAPAHAQIGVGINIGPAPICPYGYFDYAPYDCAPYGYYGPDWFVGGLFLGAGPWFHGPRGFYGHVDNRYDPRGGYRGPLPGRGAAPFAHFQGNEARDGQGHVGNAGHEPANEHSAGFAGHGSPGGGRAGGGRPR